MLLHQWFQVAHVKQWYARGETYSLNIIREQYLPRIIKPDDIPNFIIHLDGKPVGYIQLYQVSKSLPEGVDNYSHTLFKHTSNSNLEVEKARLRNPSHWRASLSRLKRRIGRGHTTKKAPHPVRFEKLSFVRPR